VGVCVRHNESPCFELQFIHHLANPITPSRPKQLRNRRAARCANPLTRFRTLGYETQPQLEPLQPSALGVLARVPSGVGRRCSGVVRGILRCFRTIGNTVVSSSHEPHKRRAERTRPHAERATQDPRGRLAAEATKRCARTAASERDPMTDFEREEFWKALGRLYDSTNNIRIATE
jgi:hypothetical protein